MKKLLTFYMMFCVSTFFSQTPDTSYIIKNSEKPEFNYMVKAGSCSSPDGPMQPIVSPPGSYNYLESNAYCYAGIPTTNTVTMCFTFTPVSSSVNLNAGFSEICNNNTFTAFNLYNSSCTYVTSSLTPTGLISGQQYTWCVTMRAWGGIFCNGYETFCPYWIPIYGLASQLVYFKTDCNKVEWETNSETNSDFYAIESSLDGEVWSTLKTIDSKNSEYGSYYSENIKINSNLYLRLVEHDINGSETILKTILAKCDVSEEYKYYDLTGKYLGKEAPIKNGIYLKKDSNGNSFKIII